MPMIQNHAKTWKTNAWTFTCYIGLKLQYMEMKWLSTLKLQSKLNGNET
jgi:hypothetical protein